MTTQSFEEAIQEFIERSREMLEQETTESLPPGLPSPYRQDGPPYECAIRLDERTIRNYVRTIGEDNPLYTNPAYAKSSKYGCLTIPGPFLSMVRGITAHGAQSRRGGPAAARRLPRGQLLLRHRLGVLRRTPHRLQVQFPPWSPRSSSKSPALGATSCSSSQSCSSGTTTATFPPSAPAPSSWFPSRPWARPAPCPSSASAKSCSTTATSPTIPRKTSSACSKKWRT